MGLDRLEELAKRFSLLLQSRCDTEPYMVARQVVSKPCHGCTLFKGLNATGQECETAGFDLTSY
jgi:hypothetical protein